MCIDMDIVLAYVQLGQNDDAARILDEAKVKLAAISSTETVVYSKYYAATAQFRKVDDVPGSQVNLFYFFIQVAQVVAFFLLFYF